MLGDSFSDIEFAWHSPKGKATRIRYMWKGLCCEKDAADDYGFRHHPMMKPVRVMQWCIRECRLEPGATILDPYMGSGNHRHRSLRDGHEVRRRRD